MVKTQVKISKYHAVVLKNVNFILVNVNSLLPGKWQTVQY